MQFAPPAYINVSRVRTSNSVTQCNSVVIVMACPCFQLVSQTQRPLTVLGTSFPNRPMVMRFVSSTRRVDRPSAERINHEAPPDPGSKQQFSASSVCQKAGPSILRVLCYKFLSKADALSFRNCGLSALSTCSCLPKRAKQLA